jgi:hypothetical protein
LGTCTISGKEKKKRRKKYIEGRIGGDKKKRNSPPW